jgi:hypothetical protein
MILRGCEVVGGEEEGLRLREVRRCSQTMKKMQLLNTD